MKKEDCVREGVAGENGAGGPSLPACASPGPTIIFVEWFKPYFANLNFPSLT